MSNSTDSPYDTLTILHTFDGQTLFLDDGALPDGETTAMLRFAECAATCSAADLHGCYLDQFQRADGSYIYDWSFDLGQPAGRLLHRIYLDALRGVMPPDPDFFVEMILSAAQ